MADNNNINGKDFLLGAVVGGVIGAISALLLAPKSGKELRGDIGHQYHNVKEKTQEIAEVVNRKSHEVADKAKEVASQMTADLKQWREGRKETAAPTEEIATSEEQ